MFCVPGGRPAYVEPVMTIKLNQIKFQDRTTGSILAGVCLVNTIF